MLAEYIRNASKKMMLGDYKGACDEFFAAISLNPPPTVLAELYFQLAIAFVELCEYDEAEECALRSRDMLKGFGRSDVGHIAEILISIYEKANYGEKLKEHCISTLADDENNLDAAISLARIYLREENESEAAKIMQLAATKHAGNKEVLYTCILAETKAKEFEAALRHIEEYFKCFGNDKQLQGLIGDIYHEAGMARQMVDAYEEVYNLSDADEKFKLSEYILANELYDEIYDSKKIRDILEYRLEYTSKLIKNIEFHNEPSFFKKLKVGYLSNDFRRHPVGYFLIPVFGKIKPEYGDYICYSYVDPQLRDGITDYLFGLASSVKDVFDASDQDIEQQIFDDKPDIMMELKSFTQDNKLSLYAGRLAPVQISWIGFPCSTGIAALDYVITNKRVDPYPEAQELHSEKLLYLNDNFLCCKLPVPESLGEPAFIKNGYITFGCYNNYVKITDRMLESWSKILNGVRGSKLRLMTKAYQIDYVVKQFRERLIRFGFDMENVIIEQEVALQDYYRSYDDIDIVLDTYPFNGATTTFDCLLMGVPIVTLAGERRHSRVGLDLLSYVGLEDLVCVSDEEYIEKAIELAMDEERLMDLKAKLRSRTMGSKLCDDEAFAEEYEYALRKAWITYCMKDGISKNSSLNIAKNLTELHDELVNGCRYIIKCVHNGDFVGNERERILKELMILQNTYAEEIIKSKSHLGNKEPFDLICRAASRLKEMDDDYIVRILELTLKYLYESKY